ncbi:MAG: lytic transglycosylase domain-containing protein [Alicycliphilus sp.]|jgi:soluble lytic murein transglycosylase|uniref:Transglycosylase SLT domain-containing protein n=1 Tax=Diaphorobacter limosus TaxID=3036128 RepID=A0ABZ0IZE3_9BURK|nr:transglycosylase SLT domain-containing protein [Diaphorobacter sp. Y-1]MBP7327084.1 lytic transglycosylase domain-containing protein [Alicycliphilus sp.]MBP7330262.1 lytic transglycosylase domain-containing protein [Alicycliphilus sp.]MCA0441894.1 lytic transglycosylase domain-containing protein [Pseudomonadota bacterium]WOO30819.1 transglycosylase SLT domain-containing protein [Diaphorobacter sp. Y-1]
MQWLKILTPLLTTAVLAASAPWAAAQNRGDDTLLEMQQAFRKGDRQRLTTLLPGARGHVLEPWAAYWELRARLDMAQPAEVNAFLQRWAGSYQEDRLRNDWLLLLGQRRDWEQFAELHPHYRMGDDREVRCYALAIDQIRGQAAQDAGAEVLRNWYALRDMDDGCANAAAEMLAARQVKPLDIWRKARLAAEANRLRVARKAVEVVAPEALAPLREALDAPAKYLKGHATARGRERQELVVLALIRMAVSDAGVAAGLLENKWGVHLSAEERNWLWGVIGKQAALALSPDAAGYFGNVSRDADLNDDLLAWKVRAALRAGQWKQVGRAIDAMSPTARQDSTWTYWKARSLTAGRAGDEERAQARQLYERIAASTGFYEQLALEELGERVTPPPAPAPLTDAEKAAARANPGLQRALYAIAMGLRAEGVREWNYSTNLHQAGGMAERELLAAADLACQQQVWDRCINTSERTKTVIDAGQRFPMPFRSAVVERAQGVGLDPAYVYGLIRQESRFIMDARSGVGASGLMQVMPATARWTAKKIGLTGFTPSQINDRDTNITIGTAYLKLALDDFDGSMPLAAAAYNAGPGRPRNWRNGPVLDAAIWAENVPFNETRDYVKKVLANTVNYAAILTGAPQSLKSRLGQVGPRGSGEPEPNKDLP